MQKYKLLMKKCIKLAKQGQGKTSPNPLVGCIVINNKGEIISTGYHRKYGENHAERDALLKLNAAQDCTLIVNLEPCSHFGKTPPCTDIIIEKGIKKVVYGMKDVNPIVAGNGIKKLQEAKIEVIGPILETECKKLNEIFITNQTQKRTFVALKTATTIDGKIATSTNDSKWITSEKAREYGKNLRKIYDAILTSSSTILADNPEMKHNKKIILDKNLKTNLKYQIYKQGEIIVFYNEASANKAVEDSQNITYINTPIKNNNLDLDFILKKLFELKIMSVFVEAGGTLNSSFLPYTDKLYHFIAPKILGDNSGKSCFSGNNIEKISNCTNLKCEETLSLSPDTLIIYSKNNSKI
jgi:diaminohydroxyphosphoribosylaminopyrimidine deaminase/5-amino-6-(5-phosphoribosylamino)uracil reductase